MVHLASVYLYHIVSSKHYFLIVRKVRLTIYMLNHKFSFLWVTYLYLCLFTWYFFQYSPLSPRNLHQCFNVCSFYTVFFSFFTAAQGLTLHTEITCGLITCVCVCVLGEFSQIFLKLGMLNDNCRKKLAKLDFLGKICFSQIQCVNCRLDETNCC